VTLTVALNPGMVKYHKKFRSPLASQWPELFVVFHHTRVQSYRYRHSDLNFLWYFTIPGFRATVSVTVTWTFCAISSYPVSVLRTVTVSDLNFLWYFIIPLFSSYCYRYRDLNFLWYITIPGFRATVTVTVTWTLCCISSYQGFLATVTVTVTWTFCGISSYPGLELPLTSQWPELFVVFHHTRVQSYRYRHSDLNFLWYLIILGFRATVSVTMTWTFCGIVRP
jgi:hypothetical protein